MLKRRLHRLHMSKCHIVGNHMSRLILFVILPKNKRHFSGPRNLTIQNAMVGDSKTYKCLASNAVGDSEKEFVLQVYRKYNIFSQFR